MQKEGGAGKALWRKECRKAFKELIKIHQLSEHQFELITKGYKQLNYVESAKRLPKEWKSLPLSADPQKPDMYS